MRSPALITLIELPPQKEEGAARAAPSLGGCLGLVRHCVAGAHPERALVRVKEQKQAANDDRDEKRDDVESRDSDLVDDLVHDFDDAVENHSPDPAHVGFWVEARGGEAG